MPTNRGFTLIEILIVIVIIGITIGFAIIAYGDFGASRRLQFAAEQLVNTVKLAQQQAILESGTLGIRLNNSGYRILKYQNSSMQWQPISNKGVFKEKIFPKNTKIKLNAKSINNAPSIILHAAGTMTPFTLTIGNNKEENIIIITGHHNGNIQLNWASQK